MHIQQNSYGKNLYKTHDKYVYANRVYMYVYPKVISGDKKREKGRGKYLNNLINLTNINTTIDTKFIIKLLETKVK